MRIVLSGGGTLGPVTPLLALVDELRRRGTHEFLWIGTKEGIEYTLVKEYDITFHAISAGKFRRYFDPRHLVDPFKIMYGFFQSLIIIKKFKPDCVLTAGGFVAVPVAFAAWCQNIPILVHQQDVIWGLANRIMRNFATWITINFDISRKMLPLKFKRKSFLVGNPVRAFIATLSETRKDHELLYKKFNLEQNLPIIFVLGGGTGALHLNELIAEAAPALVKFCQIIHLTGKGKTVSLPELSEPTRYHRCDFFVEEIGDALALADIVITRAGTGTFTELAALGKPTILVPLPNSQQEANALYAQEKHAALVVHEEGLSGEKITKEIKQLLENSEQRKRLSSAIAHCANPESAREIVDLIEKK